MESVVARAVIVSSLRCIEGNHVYPSYIIGAQYDTLGIHYMIRYGM